MYNTVATPNDEAARHGHRKIRYHLARQALRLAKRLFYIAVFTLIVAVLAPQTIHALEHLFLYHYTLLLTYQHFLAIGIVATFLLS